MTLSRLQSLELRAVDGFASADELSELGASPEALDAAREPGGLLREALLPASTPALVDAVMATLEIDEPARLALVSALAVDRAPELADAVMAQLGVAEWDSRLLADALGGGPAPELADAVFAQLGLADPSAGLLAALLADDAPELADDVMAQLGFDDLAFAGLRDALAAPRGPDLWGAVSASLDLDDDAAAAAAWPADRDALRAALADPAGAPDLRDAVMVRLGLEQPVLRLPVGANASPAAAPRSWGFAGVALAAAAALLLVFTRPVAPESDAVMAVQLSAINNVEIEELSVSEDAMVQLLQFDENAPTIIFIEDLGSDEEGATL